MSSISGISPHVSPYQPTKAGAAPKTPAPATSSAPAATSDADHDGDKDGAGIDVNG
jgi:hypothetical protein